ncbi:hypothetical protein bcgnr5379_61250 [Bacillus cereus]
MNCYRYLMLLAAGLVLVGTMQVAQADACPSGTITNPVGAGGRL